MDLRGHHGACLRFGADDFCWHGHCRMGEKLRDRNDTRESCPFCRTDEALLANSLAYARLDKFPVTPGHVLIIPLRHEPIFFSVSHEELKSIWALVVKAKQLIDRKFQPDGYNLGVNVGRTSGQTIAHTHLHLIPRYRGDAVDPSGGVRGVIPAKQHYEQEI